MRMDRRPVVAVTQRVVEVPSYGEVRDCLDQAWTSWLDDCGYTAVPVPNLVVDVGSFVDRLDVVGVILTGGNNLAGDVYDDGGRAPGASAARDRTEFALLDHCADRDIPVMAFCRGLQVLHVHAGGRLTRLGGSPSRHVATIHEVTLTSNKWRTLAGAPDIRVNSFHDYGFVAEGVASEYEVAAVASHDQVVEGLVHRTRRITGACWHPERTNPAGDFDRALLAHVLQG